MEIGEFGVGRPDFGGRRPRGDALGNNKGSRDQVLSPFVYFAPNRECDWAYANHPGGAGKNVRWYHYNKAILEHDPIPGMGLCHQAPQPTPFGQY